MNPMTVWNVARMALRLQACPVRITLLARAHPRCISPVQERGFGALQILPIAKRGGQCFGQLHAYLVVKLRKAACLSTVRLTGTGPIREAPG